MTWLEFWSWPLLTFPVFVAVIYYIMFGKW